MFLRVVSCRIAPFGMFLQVVICGVAQFGMDVCFLAHHCRTVVGWDGDFSVIKPKHFGGREIGSRTRILGCFFGGGEIAPQAHLLTLTRCYRGGRETGSLPHIMGITLSDLVREMQSQSENDVPVEPVAFCLNRDNTVLKLGSWIVGVSCRPCLAPHWSHAGSRCGGASLLGTGM